MDPHEGRVAGRLVWAVALGSFVTQLALTSSTRAWSWDEAIYLSQVTRGTQALPFVASRARGITLLVAPLTRAGAPGWMIRLALAAASSVVLALVFRLWVPRLGFAAPIGAFLFAASWPALFYGSEVMPNLWAALFGVGLVACVARAIEGLSDDRRWRVGIVAFAGSMALMRPPDALVLGLALALAVLVFGRTARRTLLFLAAGVALGWIPWLIEMSVRFGGPFSALEAAGTVSHLGGSGLGLAEHLALTDGPLLGPDPGGQISIEGALWWAGLVVLMTLALVIDRRGERALSVRVAAIGGLSLAIEYLVLVSGLAPRFLLPSLALLSLVAACGLDGLRRSEGAGRTVAGVAAIIIAVWAIGQVRTLTRLETQAVAERAVPAAVGEAIGNELAAPTTPCLILSAADYPQVAFAARCAGRELAAPGDAGVPQLPERPGVVVLVTRAPIAGDSRASGLEPMGQPAPGWFAYRSLARSSG